MSSFAGFILVGRPGGPKLIGYGGSVATVDQLQDHREFLLRQRVTLMVNRYEVFAPAHPGTGSKEEGELLVFVEQKRMKLKEEINFWSGRDKSTVLFSVKAENVLDPRGRYQLLDAGGQLIARFKKNFARSLARSTWHLQDTDGSDFGLAVERNLFAALFRRYATLIPYIGELLGLMPIAYNFDFTTLDEQTRWATNERLWSIRDRYRLTVHEGGDLDRRLLIAIAVCQDALQRR
jgi:uncharacterized protein YxjI